MSSQLRAATIRRFARHDLKSVRGTKDNPDVFYGFAGDMWQAAVIGVTWLDRREGRAR